MDRKEVFDKLNKIFCEVFDLSDVQLNDETTSNDIEEWDSLAQIQLVSLIEKEFHSKFKARDIISWQNVGEMVDTILKTIN